MKYTNININSDKHVFKYLIEYNNDQKYNTSDIPYTLFKNKIDMLVGDVVRCENNWFNIIDWCMDKDINNISLANPYDTASIRIYFPNYSVDTYQNTKYALTINTWINGIYISLGSYILDRINTIASDKIMRFNDEEYYEYIPLTIIDPWDLMYSDNWREFRESICGEKVNEEGFVFNNTGAQLNFTLHPVENIDGVYIKLNEYNGGQNSINISNIEKDYLRLALSYKFNNNGELVFNSNIIFNNVYDKNIYEYFAETYNTNLDQIKYNLIIKDNNNLYRYLEYKSKEVFYEFNKKLLNYNNWNDWNEGITIISSASFLNNESEEILYILSNEIPITQELFKYMITSEINKINLNDIKMNKYEINAVNKNINNIIKVNKPENSKNNISQSIFFRTRDLNNLIIHPNVIENICINLDAYKSRVEVFYLQIGNIIFKQIGANGYGIIFKIIGNQLPQDIKNGTYYILNEEYELVTSGKYIIQL